MLLSIGMIVKNEEKYLDRCLTAMQPILDSIDSEIIIADTGSTDNTVEIAKRHTDNVFYFEWINDFAAARNSTLKRAKGEWFMFVDADEIFQDCDDIIDFFKSGNYKKYNTATFIVRNYASSKKDHFSDFNAPRMIKLAPNIEFEFPIHEGYNSFSPPVRILSSIADHYGYINDDEKNTSKEKSDRNLPMLLKRLEEEENPKALLFMQIFESMVDSNRKEADKYLDMGLKRSIEEKSIMVAAFYKKKATCAYNDADYGNAVKYCLEYLNINDKSLKPFPTGSDGEMTAFLAHIYDCMDKPAEAVNEYIKFFRYYKDFCNGKLDTNDILMYELHYLSKSKFYLNVSEFLSCCIKAKKYNTACDYIKILTVDKYPANKPAFINDRIKSEILIAENVNFKNFSALFSHIPDAHKSFFYKFVKARLFNVPDSKEYIRRINELQESVEFSDAAAIITDYFEGNDVSGKISEYVSRYNPVNSPEMLYMLISGGYDVQPLSRFNVSLICSSCCGDFDKFYDNLEKYDVSVCSGESLSALADIYSTAVISSEREKRSAVKLLEQYGRVGKMLTAGDDSSDNIRGAAAACGIISCLEARDFKGCIAYMRSLLKIFPEFKAVITEYQEIIKSAAGINKPQDNSLASMAMLVKRNIRQMISGGNTDGAAAALAELEKLVPNDPELSELRELLSGSNS